jgi:hypothetical protein
MSLVPTLARPIEALSQLLLAPELSCLLPIADLPDCLRLSDKHHVTVRWLQALPGTVFGRTPAVAEWAHSTLAREQARIDHALSFLEAICDELHRRGCDVTVIKSLDHWPDLGSDLDLYSNAPARDLILIMRERFKAELAPRSWGDRLAGKWNFMVPGLPEAVEAHIARLGQTGEHVGWAKGVPDRSVRVQRAQYAFRVAAPDDRLMISTLQRMYRHFYFRLCDIVDTRQLVDARVVDFGRLRSNSEAAGIWKGVASYLVIVSDYVEAYRGEGLALPPAVRAGSTFRGNQLTFRRDFLRIPIVPYSVALYTSELSALARKGELPETFRLGLLPCLAAAAALGQKLTGSDKGIW